MDANQIMTRKAHRRAKIEIDVTKAVAPEPEQLVDLAGWLAERGHLTEYCLDHAHRRG